MKDLLVPNAAHFTKAWSAHYEKNKIMYLEKNPKSTLP